MSIRPHQPQEEYFVMKFLLTIHMIWFIIYKELIPVGYILYIDGAFLYEKNVYKVPDRCNSVRYGTDYYI